MILLLSSLFASCSAKDIILLFGHTKALSKALALETPPRVDRAGTRLFCGARFFCGVEVDGVMGLEG